MKGAEHRDLILRTQQQDGGEREEAQVSPIARLGVRGRRKRRFGLTGERGGS
jgi:hypothetical protein